jgi:hypothetical protein
MPQEMRLGRGVISETVTVGYSCGPEATQQGFIRSSDSGHRTGTSGVPSNRIVGPLFQGYVLTHRLPPPNGLARCRRIWIRLGTHVFDRARGYCRPSVEQNPDHGNKKYCGSYNQQGLNLHRATFRVG